MRNKLKKLITLKLITLERLAWDSVCTTPQTGSPEPRILSLGEAGQQGAAGSRPLPNPCSRRPLPGTHASDPSLVSLGNRTTLYTAPVCPGRGAQVYTRPGAALICDAMLSGEGGRGGLKESGRERGSSQFTETADIQTSYFAVSGACTIYSKYCSSRRSAASLTPFCKEAGSAPHLSPLLTLPGRRPARGTGQCPPWRGVSPWKEAEPAAGSCWPVRVLLPAQGGVGSHSGVKAVCQEPGCGLATGDGTRLRSFRQPTRRRGQADPAFLAPPQREPPCRPPAPCAQGRRDPLRRGTLLPLCLEERPGVRGAQRGDTH